MSADAKAWMDETGAWRALHDGPCVEGLPSHDEGTAYDLVDVLTGVEVCMGGHLRWEFRQFPDGIGLVGYRA